MEVDVDALESTLLDLRADVPGRVTFDDACEVSRDWSANGLFSAGERLRKLVFGVDFLLSMARVVDMIWLWMCKKCALNYCLE